MSDVVVHNQQSHEGFNYSIAFVKNGKRYSINNFVTELNVFESLFAKAMQLKIGMVDGAGLIKAIALQPGDVISVMIQKDDKQEKKVEKDFVILEIQEGDRTQNSQGRSYSISGLTQPAHNNQVFGVSRSINGSVSEMIEQVAKDFLKIEELEVEETLGGATYVCANLPPFKIIDALTQQAVAADAKGDDNLFFFYENADGFKFKSLRKIITDAATHNYVVTPDKNRSENEQDIYRVMSFRQLKTGSQSEQIKGGMLENEVLEFNVLNRTLVSSRFRYKDKSEDIHILGKNPGRDLETNIDQWVSPEDSRNSGNAPHVVVRSDETAFNRSNYFTRKYGATKAQKHLFNQICFTLSFHGNPMLRAGDLIEIESPEFSAKEVKEQDHLFNGKFLIGNVRHRIVGSDQFVTHVDIFKDGYDTAYRMQDDA